MRESRLSEKLNSPLTSDELSVLCWQLARLFRAGISWQDGVALLLDDVSSPRLHTALLALYAQLGTGLSLAKALERSGLFPDYLLRMTGIGEASGRTEEVLAALSDYYRQEASTAESVRRAVTYPAVMAALISLIFLVLVLRVLPVFTRVLGQLGAGSTPVTAALVRLGSGGNYLAGGLALLLLVASVVLLFLFRRSGGRFLPRGATARALARSRFASAMALMLRSGLPTDEALSRTADLLLGSPLEDAMALCCAKSLSGMAFPQAVEEAGIFSGIEVGLLSAGFRAGDVDSTMAELARRCQAEGEASLSRLLSRFEYSLVLLLCLAVGLVLLSVMLPLVGILAAMGG